MAVDWWSLGVVMYRMMCGTHPFKCMHSGTLAMMIMEDEVEFPSSLDRIAESVLQGLLTKYPESRLGGGGRGFEDLKGHAFFRSVKWGRMLARKIPPPFKPILSSEDDLQYFDTDVTGRNIEAFIA